MKEFANKSCLSISMFFISSLSFAFYCRLIFWLFSILKVRLVSCFDLSAPKIFGSVFYVFINIFQGGDRLRVHARVIML